MYMRYYPKQIKPINRMDVPVPDKGKRHYWGYQKGDYGFYSSEDREHIRKMNDIYRHRRHTRSHTIDAGSLNRQNQYHNFETKKNETIAQDRDVNKISNPEQIRLPSILKISRQTQTSFTEAKPTKAQPIRYHTEPEQPEQQEIERKNTNSIQFAPSTRFSPTFVCSVLNPLPSYIIKPQHYSTRNYVRIQNQSEDKINSYRLNSIIRR